MKTKDPNPVAVLGGIFGIVIIGSVLLNSTSNVLTPEKPKERLTSSSKTDTKDHWRLFFDALRFVETSHMADPPDGDGGRSKGPYQISEAYWIDSTITGQWDNVYSVPYSELVMTSYWLRYCPDAVYNQDWETMARIHNGGPRGHKKGATRKYWAKVKAYMEKSNDI